MRHLLLIPAAALVIAATPPEAAHAAERWTYWASGNLLEKIAVSRDAVWCASHCSLVRWDRRDYSYRQFIQRDIPWPGNGACAATDAEGNFYYAKKSIAYRFDGVRAAVYDTTVTGMASRLIDHILPCGNGDLWFASSGYGLVRYDGRSRKVFTPADSIKRVYDIVHGTDGAVWFAATNGAWRYKDGKWKLFDAGGGIAGIPVYAAATDSAGKVWFGTAGAIYRFDGVVWKTYGKDDGIPSPRVQAMAADREGNVWGGTNSGIVRIDSMGVKVFMTGDGPHYGRATGIAVDRRGRVWFCHGLTDKGVSVYDHGVWSHRSPTESGLPDRAVRSVACDRTGVLWFGLDYGAVSFDGAVWREYSTANGLVSNNINRIVGDSRGNVWFIYDGEQGFSRFDGTIWTNWTTKDGSRPGVVTAIGEGGDGTMYACAYGAVSRLEGSAWIPVPDDERLKSNVIMGMAETPDGMVWCATDRGLSRFDGVSWRTWTAADGLPCDEVRVVCASKDGRVWLSSQKKLCCFDGTSFTVHPLPEDNRAIFMENIAIDGEGTIWTDAWENISTEGTWTAEGIWRFRNGAWDLAIIPEKLRGANIFIRGVVSDGGKSVWFASYHGLFEWNGTTFVLHRTNTPDTFWSEDIAVDRTNTVWFANMGVAAPTHMSSFDGIKWTSYDGISAPLLTSERIEADEWNSIWLIWTHLFRFDGVTMETVQKQENFSEFGAITAFMVGKHGSVWMGTQEQGLFNLVGRYWEKKNWLPESQYVIALAAGADGAPWIGTQDGISWPGNGERRYHRTDFPVHDIAVGNDGTAWIATSQSLIRFDGSTWTEFTRIPGLDRLSGLNVAIDLNSVLWLGTWGDGLLRYDGREWKRYTAADALTSNHVNRIAVDRLNRKWISNERCIVMLDDGPAAVVAETAPAPFAITGNHPNPFNAGTVIEFTQPYMGKVTLDVYDILGRKVRRIEAANLPAGRNALAWDGNDSGGARVSSGVYLYRLRVGGKAASGRMTMVK